MLPTSSTENVYKFLRHRFEQQVASAEASGPLPHVEVQPQAWRDVAQYLADDERLGFNFLRCITGVDHLEEEVFTLYYHLHAIRPPESGRGGNQVESDGDFWRLHAELNVKTRIPRDNPRIASVADIWPAADWHERENYDLLGIIFDGHPDLKRILCADDWVGHPLRKDYEFPLEFNGIPAVTEYAMTRPQH